MKSAVVYGIFLSLSFAVAATFTSGQVQLSLIIAAVCSFAALIPTVFVQLSVSKGRSAESPAERP